MKESGKPAEVTNHAREEIMTITPEQLEAAIDGVLEARETHLAERPVAEIIRVLDRVSRRFLRIGDPIRAAAIEGLCESSGYSTQMADAVVDGMAVTWRTSALEALIREEFGDPRVLDMFVDRPGGESRLRVFGPRLTTHIFSGNVPGVSVISMVRALLVKSASLGKTARAEPIMAPLFVTALSEVDPGLGACLAVRHWRGGDEALDSIALSRAEAVIVYGSSGTVRSVRERAPAGRPFLGYGHRVSLGVVAREALASEAHGRVLAGDVSRAIAMFDQRGCVSPHVVYVEEGGEITLERWAFMLGEALERLRTELPRGPVTAEQAAEIRQVRARAEFGELAGNGHQLFASDGTDWTVVVDPDPTFSASCLNRTISLRPVQSLDDVFPVIAPAASVLQTIAFAGPERRLVPFATRAALLGASRITSFRRMPWPAPEWHHDGRPVLRDLVRWCDLENLPSHGPAPKGIMTGSNMPVTQPLERR
ncbi:MAG: hypothetical protein LBG44_00295 [Gemmatimonadota bacterium]|jgi:hypothetical protein|nr:hypothetical protein [Gemmatimonadota bacterium]